MELLHRNNCYDTVLNISEKVDDYDDALIRTIPTLLHVDTTCDESIHKVSLFISRKSQEIMADKYIKSCMDLEVLLYRTHKSLTVSYSKLYELELDINKRVYEYIFQNIELYKGILSSRIKRVEFCDKFLKEYKTVVKHIQEEEYNINNIYLTNTSSFDDLEYSYDMLRSCIVQLSDLLESVKKRMLSGGQVTSNRAYFILCARLVIALSFIVPNNLYDK